MTLYISSHDFPSPFQPVKMSVSSWFTSVRVCPQDRGSWAGYCATSGCRWTCCCAPPPSCPWGRSRSTGTWQSLSRSSTHAAAAPSDSPWPWSSPFGWQQLPSLVRPSLAGTFVLSHTLCSRFAWPYLKLVVHICLKSRTSWYSSLMTLLKLPVRTTCTCSISHAKLL